MTNQRTAVVDTYGAVSLFAHLKYHNPFLILSIDTATMSDPTTQSNYLQIASENISFDWTLDFAKQTISGTAALTLRAKEDGVQEVM